MRMSQCDKPQGYLHCTDQELEQCLNSLCKGIRSQSFRKLILLILWARMMYRTSGQREGGKDFDEFVGSIPVDDVTLLLSVSKRAAADYLKAARLVALIA